MLKSTMPPIRGIEYLSLCLYGIRVAFMYGQHLNLRAGVDQLGCNSVLSKVTR